MSLLGINLQRIGQEAEGTDVLEAAFKGDPFNTWTGNTLTLLDNFKRGDFERFQTTHFEVKLHKKERAALEPYVRDLLEKAYNTLTVKYNFTPQGPLQFEMFPDHGDFEVRAVGLTGLGALGVCFGNLFVMDSPSAKEIDHFNWGSTLWHEFTHIITLQMTDNKVPRWFSEGLSVYEERKAYPGWGDDMKLDWPMAETPTHVMTMAFDPDLDDAVVIALRDMIKLICARTGLSREDAYTLCSLAADLRVTQVVNGSKGIHCMLEKRCLVR